MLTRLLCCLTVACISMVIIGCSAHTEAKRPTINELYADALAASRVRHQDPAQQALQNDASSHDASEKQSSRPRPPLMQKADETSPRVSEVFVQTDLRQAILTLAAQAGVDVTLDLEVQGLADAVIEDQPFEVALQKLLMPSGFVYRKQGEGTYLIGVADPASSLFPLLAERRDYYPRHLSVTELTGLVADRYQPFLRANEKHNLIVIEAPAALAERIDWELEQSDRAVPQVVLEAIVCVFSPENKYRFGLDLEQGASIGGDDFVNAAMRNLNLSAAVAPGSSGIVDGFRFTAVFLRALEQEGYLAIRAAPRVMAQSGEEAKILIGRETFFGVQPEVGHAFVRQEIKQVESGIILDFRPIVRNENIVVHINQAEVSEDLRINGMDNQHGNNRFPVINRRRVSTTVSLADGETIVIGGLVQRREVDQRGQVPVAGDVPGVGEIFKKIEREDKQAEVAIFISAKIVGGEG